MDAVQDTFRTRFRPYAGTEDFSWIFFDCEFTGLRRDTTLVSIAFVDEKGNRFYAELTDYDRTHTDKWLKDNVLNRLILNDWEPGKLEYTEIGQDGRAETLCRGSSRFVAKHALCWLVGVYTSEGKRLQFVGDCMSYDMVLAVDLLTCVTDSPGFLHREIMAYIPLDLATRMQMEGLNADLPRDEMALVNAEYVAEGSVFVAHNALSDALTIRACWDLLEAIRPSRPPEEPEDD
jgi:hypothetical protein